MRTALDGVGLRPAFAVDETAETWRIDPATHQAVESLRRIMGADGADLMRLNRLTGAVSVAVQVGSDRVAIPRIVRDALAAQRDLMFTDQQPRWIEGWPDASRATLIVRIAEREAHSYFLVARIADVPGVRDRALALAPDLVRLIGVLVDAGLKRRTLVEERDAAAQALDHDECGVVVVRSDCSIVLANAAARAALAAEAGLHVRHGTVHATGYADAIRFRAAMERIVHPPAGEPSSPRGATVLLLTATAQARPPVIAIAPVERRSASTGGAAAVIYLIQPSDGMPHGLETLCGIHGLSRVETRLMVHLASGLAVAEAAGEMRVKTETARSYLKQIFGKVGVHRQTDLVILMARYQRALRGEFQFRAA